MQKWTLVVLSFLLFTCAEPTYETIDGILQVPENRENPNSRTLNLVYKVLKAKEPDSLKAPIVFLQGGPGAPTLIMEEFWKNHSLRNDRDIILMDQRGTGGSEANCTELGNSFFNIMRQDLDIEDDYKISSAQLDKCREAIQQKGVDIAGYNSRENAADFEDLRKALGYEKWNLFGASYGTRLGLTIMRDFPNSVRSSILAGVLPPESGMFHDRVKSIDNSLFTVLQRCEENVSCNARYPNLKERLIKVLKKLESDPLHFDFNGKPYVVNLQDAFAVINILLYEQRSIADIPLLIEALEKGYTETITDHLKIFESFSSFINLSMLYSVTAYEGIPFYNALKTEKAIQQSEISFVYDSFDLGVKLLANWHPYRATEFENQAVISDIPTLMASGGLDPATPPSNAASAVKNLKNGYDIVFQDESHNLFGPCFFQIAEDFLNNPLSKPNTDCSLKRNPIEWNLSNPIH